MVRCKQNRIHPYGRCKLWYISDRDMAITEYILDVQARTGSATVNANWHKNAKQNVIEIVKKFIC